MVKFSVLLAVFDIFYSLINYLFYSPQNTSKKYKIYKLTKFHTKKISIDFNYPNMNLKCEAGEKDFDENRSID